MKATLVKKQANWYNLYHNDIGIGSTHAELQGYKLSLKNCQAVERGYDLDELAKTEYPICEVWNEEDSFIRKRAFQKGFQKALELMGDKKFSRDDMIRASDWYVDTKGKKSIDELIESLQQKEWDVEIEMEKKEYIWSPPGEGFEDQTYRDWREVPKLDADGWLILKRI